MQISILCAVRDRRLARRLCMELEDRECCVFRIASDGQDALAICREFVPDILIVDAVLPRLDGLGLMDTMRDMLGARMPRVIGGSMLRFADEGFHRRGAAAVLNVPWEEDALRSALLLQMERLQSGIDWDAAAHAHRRAGELLRKMGMRSALRGYEYLSWAAALAYDSESRLEAVRERIYRPIAEEFDTTPQNVERLIRHAVERTMDGERSIGVYQFFGNTIDPTRGKPTNAQCISALAQRLRMQGSADWSFEDHEKRA